MMEAFEKIKKTSHFQKSIRVNARKQWLKNKWTQENNKPNIMDNS